MHLKNLFYDAFAKRPRPEANQILRHGVARGDELRNFLVGKTSETLTAEDIRTEVEGYLSLLSPEAFLYFLPAFLHASLAHDDIVSVFSSGLIGVLTKPNSQDGIDALDRLREILSEATGLTDDTLNQIEKQQSEWFSSTIPETIFHERFNNLTHDEGAAILAFLIAFEKDFGMDFPFDELKTAIDRHWYQYK